jgi:hypothetical protein
LETGRLDWAQLAEQRDARRVDWQKLAQAGRVDWQQLANEHQRVDWRTLAEQQEARRPDWQQLAEETRRQREQPKRPGGGDDGGGEAPRKKPLRDLYKGADTEYTEEQRQRDDPPNRSK